MKILIALIFLLIVVDQAEARQLGQGPVPDPLPPTGPRVYPCFQFPDNRLPVIDGDLSDWELVGDDYAQDTFDLIEYNRRQGRNYDLQDLDVRVRTGYNPGANRIYVAVEYRDNFHNFDRVGDHRLGSSRDYPGNDDIFELVVDADNSGGDFIFDLKPHLMSTHAQNYHIYVHGRDGAHVWVWGRQHWLGERPWAKWASRYEGAHGSAGLSTLEFWVTPFNYAHPEGPEYSALARLAEGDTLGLDYAILDRDDQEEEVVKFWALADTVLMYRNADFLPDFVLAPLEERLEKLPVAEFRSRAPDAQNPRTVQFVNATSGEGADFLWDFGDGETSTEKDPAHCYREPGRYTVTLQARNAWGKDRKRKLDYVILFPDER